MLGEPIELDGVPPVGREVTASASGELTLRGVTRPVTRLFNRIANKVVRGFGVEPHDALSSTTSTSIPRAGPPREQLWISSTG